MIYALEIKMKYEAKQGRRKRKAEYTDIIGSGEGHMI